MPAALAALFVDLGSLAGWLIVTPSRCVLLPGGMCKADFALHAVFPFHARYGPEGLFRLVVFSGSGMCTDGFAGIASRAVFLGRYGPEGPLCSSCFLLVTVLLALVPVSCRQAHDAHHHGRYGQRDSYASR